VCYQLQEEHCVTYGRLYPLEESQHVCPVGWRLPDSVDIASLHKLMKSKNISDIAPPGVWEVKGADRFTNSLGLSVLPAGRIDSFSYHSKKEERWIDTVGFHQLSTATSFWLDSQPNAQGLLHWHIGEPANDAHSHMHRHRIDIHKFSVRCVKANGQPPAITPQNHKHKGHHHQ
jgi:uncharacterized protein (TIGR02145 family)